MRRFFGFGKREEKKVIARRYTQTSIHQTKSKQCGHGDCQLSSLDTCCECGDQRPISNGYEKYVDGSGKLYTAAREEYYCPACKCRSFFKSSSDHQTAFKLANSLTW